MVWLKFFTSEDLPKMIFDLPAFLVEKPYYLSSNMLSSGLFVIHDTGRGCKYNEPKLTRWQQFDNPLLEVGNTDVITRGYYSRLVDSEPCKQKLDTKYIILDTYRPFSWMTILPDL
jgi:hypothetical protein